MAEKKTDVFYAQSFLNRNGCLYDNDNNKVTISNQIADLMGISPKTVYTRLARGKKLLLDSLNGVETDEKN